MKNGPCPHQGRRTGVVPPSFQAEALQCRLLDLAANGAYRVSLRSQGSFSDRLLGGFRRGHVEPDSQRQPVFLATVPRLLVPIDAVARQLTSEG